MTIGGDMTKIGTASANPTRAFFVRMLTRDITLTDCILDLVDNSIDGAWDLEGGRPLTLKDETDLSKYKIQISFSESDFSISDNCGGISLDDAAEYAFTFGRSEEAEAESYSIGIYGIGMKRAVFKIGRKILMRSTHDQRGSEPFKVPIDVDKWLSRQDKEDWDFDIDADKPLPEPGVSISVSDLNENTAAEFSNPEFEKLLIRTLSRDYSIHLHRGLKIFVNGKQVDGWSIKLRTGADFAPMRDTYIDHANGDEVHVEVLAGMAAPPPDDLEPSEKRRDFELRSGWYVVCNGRVVVAADKSTLTGWGTGGWPKWHPQYSGFLGIVLFSAENAAALPLTTTKRSVDSTQPIYRRALSLMHKPASKWIEYTNARKVQREKAHSSEKATKNVSIFEVEPSKEARLPKFESKAREPVANIAYQMPKRKVRALAEALGNVGLAYRDVGIKSFDLAYEDFVGDE